MPDCGDRPVARSGYGTAEDATRVTVCAAGRSLTEQGRTPRRSLAECGNGLVTVAWVKSPGAAVVRGVMFDFHATLVDHRDSGAWIEAAVQPYVSGSGEASGSEQIRRLM